MNGGRKKWVDEGRPLTTEVPRFERTVYRARALINHLNDFSTNGHPMSRSARGMLELTWVKGGQAYGGALIGTGAGLQVQKEEANRMARRSLPITLRERPQIQSLA